MAGTIRDEAYVVLKSAILDSTFSAGTLFSQQKLADAIGFPLAPTREAIQMLAGEGLLNIIPKRGILIFDVNLDFMDNVFELRALIEKDAIGKYVVSADDAQIDRLIKKHEQLLAKYDPNDDKIAVKLRREAIELDWELHDTIMGGCTNPLIQNVYKVNSDKMRMIQNRRGYRAKRIRPVLEEHLEILAKIKNRDCQGSIEMMARHLESSRRNAFF